MAKNEKLIWMRVPEEMHSKVISIAGSQDRTVQGQYRHFFTLGMKVWEEKITSELSQQLETNRKVNNRKNLLRNAENEDQRKRA